MLNGYRSVLRPVSFFIIAAPWLAALGEEAAPIDVAYREELVADASRLQLHLDPYWLRLVHYRSDWLGGHTSMIDDPLFFCAEKGKDRPEEELSATLRAFFEPPSDDPEVRHPVCRFPARYAWLREMLNVDVARLPVPSCADFDRVFDLIRPDSVTLVFPAAYMNSPASMFGHTLLVFDPQDKNRLLAKGVSYAAAVTTGFGPVFALKGILGFYPGRYVIESYYDKVETYNDIHRRDIWEYELDLDAREVERMFRHAWELQNIWSRYYFFDENCAYKMYQLVDVARPGLDLSDDASFFVIPLDTVKRIASKGLVRNRAFRPSKSTRMTLMADRLPSLIRSRALNIGKGRESPEELAGDESLSLADRRLALDLGADYSQYLFTELLIDRKAYAQRFHGILRARSKLGPRADDEFIMTPPSPPEVGHSASMVTPGVGISNGELYLRLGGRVAYHELLDNDAGYTPGAQILFLNSEVRWDPDQDDVELEFADIVHVESISPRNDLFLPVSWRARLGFTQMDMQEGQDDLIFSAQTGGGGAWSPSRKHLVFAMLEAEVHLGDRYSSFVAGGPGASIGWMYTVSPRWKCLVRARTAWIYEGTSDWWRVETGAASDIRLWRDVSARLSYEYTRNDDYDIHEGSVAWCKYF